MTTNNGRMQRLRMWLLALSVFIVFAGAAAPIGVSQYLEHRVDAAQTEISCSNARFNQQTLQRLNALAQSLGVPQQPVPQLPEECM